MRRAWQLPISSMRPDGDGRVAHYFELSQDTHRQVRTLCGRIVTPGFAHQAHDETKHCEKCERNLQ